jgi:hypothetical protein
MNIRDHVLLPKKDMYHLMIRLPGRYLLCNRADFVTGSLVFIDNGAVTDEESHRVVTEKDLDTFGLDSNGTSERLEVVRPLVDVLRVMRTNYVKGLPITLDQRDDWYLTVHSYKALALTNGRHILESSSTGIRIAPTRTRRRPVTLDPIGLTKRGRPLFPLRQVMDLLTKKDGVLADPYAWRKQAIPRSKRRVEILVVGPKT